MTRNNPETIMTEDGYEYKKTSYRTWYVFTAKGDEYFIFADPRTGLLRCSCLYSAMYNRNRACRHIRKVKVTWDK